MKVKFLNSNITDTGKHLSQALALMLQSFATMKEADCTCFKVENSYYTIDQIKQMITDHVEFSNVPVWILAPSTILDQDVYSFLTDDETPRKFSDLNLVISTSLDSSQVILRTNITGSDLNTAQIADLSNIVGIEILGTKEVIEMQNSTTFKIEENI